MDRTEQFDSLAPLFERRGPFSPPNFEDCPVDETLDLVSDTRVLVVGAGGLGCEALKNLVCSGFTDIDLVDMDTVDISNLNRQFLFRAADVNTPKCEAAARFLMNHRSGIKVRPHTKRIQAFPRSWFRNFGLVVACLDNEEARLWLNETLADNVEYEDAAADDDSAPPELIFPPYTHNANEVTANATDAATATASNATDSASGAASGSESWSVTARTLRVTNPDTVTPLVDGGTEGWSGQARLLLVGHSYCLQCSAVSAPPPDQLHFHLCTIAHVPRTPEHCVMYAHLILWPRLISLTSVEQYDLAAPAAEGGPAKDPAGVELDADDETHMTWLWARACERARAFSIAEPSYTLTMQVVKNIIPAIASTNALINAAGVLEALKHVTATAPLMNQYFLYTGNNYTTGVNCQTYPYKRNAQCKACHARVLLTVSRRAPVAAVLAALNGNEGELGSESAEGERASQTTCRTVGGLGFVRASIRDIREPNPVQAQVFMANNAADAAVARQQCGEVFKEGRVYLAAGPGRSPLKFQVALTD